MPSVPTVRSKSDSSDAKKTSMILAARRHTEHRTVWSTRRATSVRPRLVVHSHSRFGRAGVAETCIKRELSGGLVEIRHHHSMLQISISSDHHTTMVGFDRDPMRDVAFSEHNARNFPWSGRI